MNIYKNNLLLIALSLSLTTKLFGWTPSYYKQVIVSNDPEYKELLLSYEAEKKQILSQEPYFSSEISLNYELSSEVDPSYNSSLEGNIARTGTTITLSHSKSSGSTVDSSNSDIKISQRVWKNGFATSYNREKKRGLILWKQAELKHQEALKDFWSIRLKQLLEYNAMNQEYKIKSSIRKNAQKTLRYMEKRFKSSIARKAELLEARNSFLLAQLQEQESFEQIKNTRNQIENLTGQRITNVNKFKIPKISVQSKDSRKLKMIHGELELAQIDLEEAKEDIKAAANIYVGASQLDSQIKTYQEYYSGISVTLPVSDQKTDFKKQYNEAKLSRLKQKIKSTATSINIASNQLLSRGHVLELKISNNRKIIKTMREIHELNWDRYQKGRINFRELASSQEKLDTMTLSLLREKNNLQLLNLEKLAFNDGIITWLHSLTK